MLQKGPAVALLHVCEGDFERCSSFGGSPFVEINEAITTGIPELGILTIGERSSASHQIEQLTFRIESHFMVVRQLPSHLLTLKVRGGLTTASVF